MLDLRLRTPLGDSENKTQIKRAFTLIGDHAGLNKYWPNMS